MQQQQSQAPAPIQEPNREYKEIFGALEIINQNQIIMSQDIKEQIQEVRLLLLRHINTNYQLIEANRIQPLRSEMPLAPAKKSVLPGKKQRIQDPGDLEDEPGYPTDYQ